MQYYPTDTYFCDPQSGEELSVTQRFKDLVLLEQPDGVWQTERIDHRFARRRALTRAECKDIAARTAKIANNIQKNVQIMWFVGLPAELGLGGNLPWFMVSPDQSMEERRSKHLSAVTITKLEDLSKLENVDSGSCKVILEPVGEDLRSDAFVQAVSARCKALSLPVEVRGSVLGHAYHQLLQAGVAVFTAEPSKKAHEVRQRKAYDKLVRDQIPDFIRNKGEYVHADELEPKDLQAALVGKLLEEAEELLSAKTTSDVAEELSDLLEVVRGLATASSIAFSEVVRRADEKAERRGGFSRGVVLRSTEAARKAKNPQLFPVEEVRNMIRLDSLQSFTADGSLKDVPLSLLMKVSSQDLTLQAAKNIRVVVRVSIKTARLSVEVRAVDIDDSDQPKLL